MSNEELAVLIKAGHTEYIPELWKQTERFIWQQARRRAYSLEGWGSVTAEDLYQSGFFALLEAVRAFEPERGYTFITYLTRPLKNAFAATAGYITTRQRSDPLQSCISLDVQQGEEADGGVLGDLIADPGARKAFDELETQQLREALVSAIEGLPAAQREVIIARYYLNRNLSHEEKVTERDALKSLRQPRVSSRLRIFC